jgi:putative flippase GtrA
MNYLRIVLAGVAAWLASIALGYLINDIWLFRLYQANAWAFRRPDDIAELLPIGLAAQLVACLAFATAYAKGYGGEGSAIGEGIRYGLVVAIMVDGFAVVWNYVSQPIATRLGVLELVARVGEFGVYGAVVGSIYRRRELPLPKVDSEIVDLEAGFRHVDSQQANSAPHSLT